MSAQLQHLCNIELHGCAQLITLPESVAQLPALTRLVVRKCDWLVSLPSMLGQLPLRELSIFKCGALECLPSSVSQLSALQAMHVKDCSALCASVCFNPQAATLADWQSARLHQITHLSTLEALSLAGFDQAEFLPDGIEVLTGLTHPDLSGCSKLRHLPDSVTQLQHLQQLLLSGCTSLFCLPHGWEHLTGLTVLQLHHCCRILDADVKTFTMQNTGLRYLGLSGMRSLGNPGFLQPLNALWWLDLSYCTNLLGPPNSLGSLTDLAYLDLTGCQSLTALPSTIGLLSKLEVLRMADCSAVRMLPASVAHLQHLNVLDLRGCTGLMGLSEAVEYSRIPGVGKVKRLRARLYATLARVARCLGINMAVPASLASPPPVWGNLHDSLCLSTAEGKAVVDVVEDRDKFFKNWPQHYSDAHSAVAAILKKQEQHEMVLKLATGQDTMLDTLERMSWLVLLLATATFLAFLQPPGGFNQERLQVLVGGRMVCGSNYTLPCEGLNHTATSTGAAGNATGSAESKSSKQLPHPYQACALYWFFICNPLSFCASLGCVMMIVVLSVPRI